MKKRLFTLVEMVVSLAVFSIFMLMMMGIYSGVQRSWSSSASELRVLENARAIFDVISDDLRYLTFSQEPGYEIGFYAGVEGGNNSVSEASKMGPFPVFVSNIATFTEKEFADAAANANVKISKLAEVAYQLAYSESGGEQITDAAELPVLFFKKRLVRSINSGWDFYYNSRANSNSDWHATGGSNFNAIAGGVLDLKIRAQNLIPIIPPVGIALFDLKEIRPGSTPSRIPICVDVELTLYDYQVDSKTNCNRSKRSFFKKIFIEQKSN